MALSAESVTPAMASEASGEFVDTWPFYYASALTRQCRDASVVRMRRRSVWTAAAFAVLVLSLVPRRSAATIAEQRARLPPAAECGDEIVAGIWRSHSYHERFGDWSVFTLTITRVRGSPEQLIGTITTHGWDGTPDEAEPPPCERQQGSDWIVSMDARGVVQDRTHLVFSGVGQWRLDRVVCHNGPGGYNLDSFSGVIDPSILEFQSVNNDGGDAVNEPTVFRRIRCPPQESMVSPSVQTRPPAFYPQGHGCARF
jgi:hypothetical protein